jgi:hypothetical protein
VAALRVFQQQHFEKLHAILREHRGAFTILAESRAPRAPERDADRCVVLLGEAVEADDDDTMTFKIKIALKCH